MKLKDILAEGFAWERKAGQPLPTLADTTAAYAQKLQEQMADEDAMEIKTYVKAITKLVAEVNQLIEKAVDSDGDKLEVVDSSSTWPSGTTYEPVTFENNVLTIKGLDSHSGKAEEDVYDINQVMKDFETNYWQLTDSVDALKYLRRGLKNAILKNSRKTPGIEEEAKPDYIDVDGDGNEKESMKSAMQDKESDSSFADYSLDALTDMKINLSRYEGNEEEIKRINAEIAKRKQNESFLSKAGLREMRELPLEQRILRNLKGNDYILAETFKRK